MRKIMLTVFLLSTASFFYCDVYAKEFQTINIYLDNQMAEEKGIIIDGQPLVPVRLAEKYLGAQINWNNNDKTVTILRTHTSQLPAQRKKMEYDNYTEYRYMKECDKKSKNSIRIL